MPRYDFSCGKCSTIEERFVRFADLDQPQNCNQCGGHLSRNLSLEVGIVWNCSGGTRGFAGGGKIAKTPFVKNPGHEEPRLGHLGLSNEQGEKLGIK